MNRREGTGGVPPPANQNGRDIQARGGVVAPSTLKVKQNALAALSPLYQCHLFVPIYVGSYSDSYIPCSQCHVTQNSTPVRINFHRHVANRDRIRWGNYSKVILSQVPQKSELTISCAFQVLGGPGVGHLSTCTLPRSRSGYTPVTCSNLSLNLGKPHLDTSGYPSPLQGCSPT